MVSLAKGGSRLILRLRPYQLQSHDVINVIAGVRCGLFRGHVNEKYVRVAFMHDLVSFHTFLFLVWM
jgi:hypothetical protein